MCAYLSRRIVHNDRATVKHLLNTLIKIWPNHRKIRLVPVSSIAICNAASASRLALVNGTSVTVTMMCALQWQAAGTKFWRQNCLDFSESSFSAPLALPWQWSTSTSCQTVPVAARAQEWQCSASDTLLLIVARASARFFIFIFYFFLYSAVNYFNFLHKHWIRFKKSAGRAVPRRSTSRGANSQVHKDFYAMPFSV